ASASAATSVRSPASGRTDRSRCRTWSTARNGPGPSEARSVLVRRSTTVRTPCDPVSSLMSLSVRSCRLSDRSSLRYATLRPSRVGRPPTSRVLTAPSSSIQVTAPFCRQLRRGLPPSRFGQSEPRLFGVASTRRMQLAVHQNHVAHHPRRAAIIRHAAYHLADRRRTTWRAPSSQGQVWVPGPCSVRAFFLGTGRSRNLAQSLDAAADAGPEHAAERAGSGEPHLRGTATTQSFLEPPRALAGLLRRTGAVEGQRQMPRIDACPPNLLVVRPDAPQRTGEVRQRLARRDDRGEQSHSGWLPPSYLPARRNRSAIAG